MAMTLPEKIHLVDNDGALVRAWSDALRDLPMFVPQRRDYFELEADAMVSPANSFGVMDGGLDMAIQLTLGPTIQTRVRQRIEERHHGELSIGAAEIIETGDARWPFLIAAPTMRVPEDVSRTVNAYVAFRAILLAVRAHNASGAKPIRTLLCSGLATGVGGMPPRRCAMQMRLAYQQVSGAPSLPSFQAIHAAHGRMKTET
jgi:O-acetyl-ADP-ribose deacetylase (regulator of RNase III)